MESSSKLKEIFNKDNALLCCPVCLVTYSERILQCEYGHDICCECRSKIEHCPQCRAKYTGTRNFALEQVIKLLKKSKALPADEDESEARGDGTVASASNLKHNLFGGPKQGPGLFPCLFKGSRTCKEDVPICRLLNHMRSFHYESLITATKEQCLPSFEHNFVISLGVHNDTFMQAYQLPLFGMFYLHVELEQYLSDIYFLTGYVKACLPLKYCKRVRYTLEVSFESIRAVFTDIPHPSYKSHDHIENAKNCLFVPFEETSEMVDLNVKLKVKRNNGPYQHRSNTEIEYSNVDDF